MAGAAPRGPRRAARKTVSASRRPAPAQAPRKLAVRRDWLLATTALLPIAAGPVMAQPAPNTGPTGGQVVAGQAGIARTPGRTTITQGTDRAAIDWQQFNVGSQHTVQFIQPNQGSWTLNRVVGPDPSVIAGRVQANGGVAIVNQSGMVFAGGAQVNVGSLIASAAGITNENFMAGRMAFDQAARPGARVENHGTITVADRGLAALVGPGVSNSGVIRARLGRVALGAAETFVLDLAGDGLIGIDVTQAVRTAPEGGAALVTNSGVIEAPGGSVLISAHAASGLVEDLVRQTGRIEAPTVGTRTGEVAIRAEGGGVRVDGRVAATGGAGERGGRIALQATGTVTAGATARIDASGGAGGGQVLVGTTGRGRNQTMARQTIVERGAEIRADATIAGDGGMLVLNSLERTEMRGALSARGGPGGGNGGFVELSGQAVLEAAGTIDLRAPAGVNGELLLDPQNIIVSNDAAPGALPAGETIELVVTTATETVNANGTGAGEETQWTRVETAAITGFAGTVTLDATRDIIVDSAVNKTNGGLTLLAGRDITVGAAITLTGPANNLTLTAGQNLVVNAPLSVAGSIIATATTGSITLNANVSAPGIALIAGTSITQTGGILSSPTGINTPFNLAVVTSGTGDVTLQRDNGLVQFGDSTVADGALSVRSVSGINVLATQTVAVNGGVSFDLAAAGGANNGIQFLGALRAQSLDITANRPVAQSAASVIVSIGAGGAADPTTPLPLTFAVTGAGDPVSLNGTNNGALRVVSGIAEDRDVTLRGAAITVAGPLTAGTGGTRNTLTLRTAGDVAIDGAVTARNLTVNADGDVTQTVALTLGGTGGSGSNGLLTIRALDGTAGAGSVALNETNSLALLDARSAGPLAFTGDAAFSVQRAEGAGITLTGGAITVTNADGITGTGAGDVLIVADSLTVSDGITAPNGRTLSLRVDALTVTGTGSLSAGATGTIEIAPRSAGFAVQVGTAGAPVNTLEIDPGDVSGATAGTLRIGRTTLSGTQTASAIDFVANLTTTAPLSLVSGGAITLNTANVTAPTVRMEAANGIALGTGNVTANGATPTITLLATGGSITQGAAGRLVSPSGEDVALTLRAPAGSVVVAGTGTFTLVDPGDGNGAGGAAGTFSVTTGTLTVSDPVTAAGITLAANTGTLTLDADIRGTSLAVSGQTGINQTGGTIAHVTTGTVLSVAANAPNGSVVLDSSGNGPLTLGGSTASGAFTVVADSIATFAPVSGAAVSLTAEAGTIEIGTDLRATGLTLSARDGISQSGGTIEHRGGAATVLDVAANVTQAGNATLDQANGALRLLTGTVSGNLSVTSARALSISAGATVGVGGAATLTVQGAGNPMTLAGELRAQSVSLSAAGPITQSGTGVLVFRNATTGAAEPATVLPFSVAVTGAGNAATLDGPNGHLRVSSATTEDGAITLRARALDVSGTISAGAAGVTLTAENATTGNVTLGGGSTITAASLTVNAARDVTQDTGGTITLDGGNGLLTLRGATGGTTRAGSLTLAGTNQIGALDLRTVTTAGALTGAIDVTLQGSVSVRQANGATVSIAADDIAIAAGQQGVTATGDVRFLAGSLAVDAAVAAGSGDTLTLRVDRLSVGAGGSLAASAGTIEIGPRNGARLVEVGGAVDLTRLQIAAAALEGANAATIRLGSTTLPATGTVTTAGIVVSEALALGTGVTLDAVAAGTISVNQALGAGTVRLTANGAGDIALGAVDVTTSAGGIVLRADGAVTQTAGGALVAQGGTRDLIVHAGSGGIALAGSGAFTLAGGIIPSGAAGPRSLYATGDVTFRTTGALTVAAAAEANAPGATLALQGSSVLVQAPLITPTTTGTVSLTATGAGGTISQTAAGLISASLLSAQADGAITLNQASNAIAALGTIAFEDSFALRAAGGPGGLAFNAAIGPTTGPDANITVRLDAGDLALNAAVNAGAGTVVLQADAGGILQDSGTSRITAGRLEVTARDNATLVSGLGGGNAVAVLGASSVGGTLNLNASGDLGLEGTIARSGAGPGTLLVQSGGAMTLATGASLGFDSIVLSAQGALTLRGTVGLTGGPAPVSTVRLGAGGDILQEAGSIRAAALGVRSGGTATLDQAGNDVRGIAASTTGSFTLTTGGALATIDLTGSPLTGFADVGGITAANVTLTASDLTVSNTAGFTLFNVGIFTPAGGVVTLRADDVALNGTILTGNPFVVAGIQGTVDIAPRTLTRGVSIGAETSGQLSLTDVELSRLVTRTLVIGHDDPTAGSLTIAAPVNLISTLADVTLRGGTVALDAALTLPTTNGLLSLHATSGDIVQAATGSVSVARLSAVADSGSVLLSQATAPSSVGQISGAVAANETFAFFGTGGFTVAAPGIDATRATVTLAAETGGISQTTGARITADRLTVTAPGTVVLDGGASALAADLNLVDTLAPSSGASFTLRNAGALAVEGVTAGIGGTVTLEAPGLTLAGNITATGGRVILRSGGSFDAPGAGSIVQDSGVIRADALSASAGGSILLANANEIARLDAGRNADGTDATSAVRTSPGGTFLLANRLSDLQVGAPVNVGIGGAIGILADGLSVAPALSGTVFLAPGGVVQFAPFTAGRAISLGGAGGINETTITAAAIERVSTGRLIIGALEPTDQVSAGTITLRGALDLTGAGAPQTLELRSGGDIVADGFALSVGQLSAVATGRIAIGTTDSFIGSVVDSLVAGTQGLSAGGASVRLVTAGADLATGLFTVAAPITTAAGGTISLQAPDFALLSAIDTGIGAAGRIELRGTRTLSLGGTVAEAGTARLTTTELALLDAHGGTYAAFGPDIRLRAWTIDPTEASRLELTLTAGGTGSIAQLPGGLSVGALDVTALQGAGSVQIAAAGNSLPIVSVTAQGPISVATEGALEVRRTSTNGGSVTYRGTDITLSTVGLTPGQLTIDAAGRTVNLTATNGDITGTTAQAAVRALALNATATQGEVRLTGDNAVGIFAGTARDGIVLRATGATTAGAVGAGGAGTEVAGAIDITAASLTLNDVLGSGTVLLTATTGDLLQASGAQLSAATLSAQAAGTLRLAGSNPDGTARNQIQDLTALTAGGDITLRNALALTLDLPISVGTDRVLTLEAAVLTLLQNLTAAGSNGQIILRTGSFNGGVASGGEIRQDGGTISAANLAALAGGSVTIDLAGNTIGALGGGRAANGAALGLGVNAGTDATLRSNGFGGSATLGVTGALQVGAGRALTLRANDLAIGAELRAPGGTITLLPVTADGSIGYVLGGASGSTNAGRITLDSTELGFLPSGTAAAELRLGALGQTGSVDIAGTVDLVDGAAPRVGRLTLAGDGALTQAAGTLLDVAVLSANFPNGAVLLDPGVAGNRIGALAGVTAGGVVDIRGGAGLMEVRAGADGAGITAAPGTSITLRADDLDLQAALRAAGGTVFILPETLGRSITLGGPDAAAGTLALGTNEIARIGGNGGTPALRLVVGSDGTLRTAGDILVAGDVALRAGATERVGTLELVAGTPGTAGGSVRQSAGTVDVATVTGTAQGDFDLGRAANAFDTATGITAGTLPTAGATGVVALGTAGALDASAISAPVSVRVSAGGALTAGGITAPRVTLEGATVDIAGLIQGSTSVAINSAGAVTQDTGALIVTGLFSVNGSSISLPEDNQILELGGLVATGPVLALNTVLPVLVSGAVSAVGSLSLTTDQGLTVAPGGSISVTGGPGSATFSAGGALDYAGTLTTSGAASLTAAGALGFTGSATVGGELTLASGTGMTLAGTISAGGAFTATAGGAIGTTAQITSADAVTLSSGGSLTASGRIEGNDLVLTAATSLTSGATLVAFRDATLRASGGAVGLTGSLTASRDVTVVAATGLTADSAFMVGRTATFNAAGTMTLAGTLDAAGLVATAGGALTTSAMLSIVGDAALSAGGALASSGTIAASGTLTLSAGTTMNLSGSVSSGTATLSASGTITTTATIFASGDIAVSAGGTLDATGRIESTGGDIAMTGATGLTSGATLVANRDATLRATGGALDLSGSLVAGRAVVASAGGALSSTGTVQAGTTLALTAGGAMTLGGTHVAGTAFTATAVTGLTTTGPLQAGTTATLEATAGNLVQSGTLTALGAASLTAGGALTNSGAISAGDAVAILAGGAVTQTGVATAAQGMAITAGGTVLLSGQTTAGTDLDVFTLANATLTGGKITTGRAVRLSAGLGVVAQSFQIDPATILLQTAGAMTLTDSGFVSSESIRLSAGAITLRRSNFTTGTLDVDSTGNLVMDGGLFTIGRAVGFSAPGGIQTQGRITVLPGGNLLPAVVFDTRAPGLPDPLGIVEPDVPGLPARQQATQVRIPGTEAPGDFGPASGAPAGNMVINIDAGRSAIFLLLDGGTATGEIASAGRLAIHGTGGSAELTGRLTDVSGTPVDGAAAARFADSTRPAASGALTRYRLNGCVVSSVNCIVPSQIISIPQAPPQQVDLRVGNNRITDPEVQVPNVADEDY